MSAYQASIANTPHARHFGTARQFAQEAATKNDMKKLAFAVRELSDGLMGLALEVSIVKQMASNAASKNPVGHKATPKRRSDG